MESSAHRWSAQYSEEMQTAATLMQAGRYRLAILSCHHALENLLKGCIVERTGRAPPRSHSLRHLAAVAGMALPPERVVFFLELSRDASAVRIPVRRGRFSRRIAQDRMARTIEAAGWLQQERGAAE